MKKLTLTLLSIAVVFGACKKSDVATSVPSTFTQKILIEEFTATWCGYCPRGVTAINNAEATYPGKVNAVAFHDSGDPMYVAISDQLETGFGISGIPNCLVNRSPSQSPVDPSQINFNTEFAKTASCGLALDASSQAEGGYMLKLKVGFNKSLTGTYHLVVYLLESNISNSSASYDQHNYMSQSGSSPDASSPWYTYPPSMHNFVHNHVFRKLLNTGGIWGQTIDAASITAGGLFTQNYLIVPAATMKAANLSVVAVVFKYDTDHTKQQVMNSQEVKLGATQDFD